MNAVDRRTSAGAPAASSDASARTLPTGAGDALSRRLLP